MNKDSAKPKKLKFLTIEELSALSVKVLQKRKESAWDTVKYVMYDKLNKEIISETLRRAREDKTSLDEVAREFDVTIR